MTHANGELLIHHQEPLPEYASPLDMPVEAFRAGLDRRGENRKALIEWVRAALKEGTDFGSFETRRGLSKPSLWKPGAEKICGMLGVTPKFPTFKDYEAAAVSGVDIKHIILRCEIQDGSGRIVAEGSGARSVEKEYGDLNKALKMASKSAHIDATLRLAGLSEVFTQDLEDMQQASADPAETTEITIDQRKAIHDQAAEQWADAVICIKDGIKEGEYTQAAATWFELPQEVKEALWLAPTKGGIFTTRERETMKSSQFRKAYYGEDK